MGKMDAISERRRGQSWREINETVSERAFHAAMAVANTERTRQTAKRSKSYLQEAKLNGLELVSRGVEPGARVVIELPPKNGRKRRIELCVSSIGEGGKRFNFRRMNSLNLSTMGATELLRRVRKIIPPNK